MKRAMSVLLAVVLSAVIGAVPGFADGPSVEVSAAEAAPGETVTLDFTLTGNPGIAAYSADITYNQNALELVTLSSGKEISGFTFIGYVPTRRVAAFATRDTSGDGVLFRAKFRVLADAAEGFAPVTVSISEMADVSYTDYSPAIVSGGVTVLPAPEGGGEADEPEDPAGEEDGGDGDSDVVDTVIIEPDESMDFGDDVDWTEFAAAMTGEDTSAAGTNTGAGGTEAAAPETETGTETAPIAEDGGDKPAAGLEEDAAGGEEAPAAVKDAGETREEEESGSGTWIWVTAVIAAVIAAAAVVYIIIKKKKAKSSPEKETEKTGVD